MTYEITQPFPSFDGFCFIIYTTKTTLAIRAIGRTKGLEGLILEFTSSERIWLTFTMALSSVVRTASTCRHEKGYIHFKFIIARPTRGWVSIDLWVS